MRSGNSSEHLATRGYFISGHQGRGHDPGACSKNDLITRPSTRTQSLSFRLPEIFLTNGFGLFEGVGWQEESKGSRGCRV